MRAASGAWIRTHSPLRRHSKSTPGECSRPTRRLSDSAHTGRAGSKPRRTDHSCVSKAFWPGWLVFGSVKWTDWSQIQFIPFCPVGMSPCAPGSTAINTLDLFYRDGWTVSGGVGHKFNDQWSGAVSLTWDRGTSADGER